LLRIAESWAEGAAEALDDGNAAGEQEENGRFWVKDEQRMPA
jgi:hypothetical protein